MRVAISTLYSQVFYQPLPNYTVTVIAEWITDREEYESNPTPYSFIRYQDSVTIILKEEEARAVMTKLLRALIHDG